MVRLLAAIFLFISVSGFGQYLDFQEPERLPSAINTEEEEIMPMLSPNGRTLYFNRVLYTENVGGKYSGSDIWISKFDGAYWKKSTNNTLPVNSKENDAVVGIGADGKVIYIMKASASKRLNGIYFSRQVGDTWTSPELIPISGLDNHGFSSFYVSPDFDVIFVSMEGKDSRGQEDLYVSLKDASGEWSKPRNLGPTINTSGFEMSPFLSADKRYLYFSSNGHQGLGDADIFCSERLYNSWETWSIPRNLGKTVNSPSFDAYFTIYGDSISYFSSNRQSKLSNIYVSRIAASTFALAPGQRLLEEEAVAELIGKGVVTSIEFEAGSSALKEPQEELLFYILNKAIKNDKINVLFVSGASELASKRMAALTEYFRTNGFDASRLSTSEMKRNPKNRDLTNTVQLRFYTQ